MTLRWTELDQQGRAWEILLDPEHEEDDIDDFARCYPAFGLYLTPTVTAQNSVPATILPARPAEMPARGQAVSGGGSA